jgi:hypothetical protein
MSVEQVYPLSDKVWGWISPATEMFEGLSRAEVESAIVCGDFQLFTGANCAAITCVSGTTLRIGLAGGDLDELLDLERQIAAYAADHECDSMEIVGRPGWERVLPGYKRTAVLMRKGLKHGLH